MNPLGASVADSPGGRKGDFRAGDSIIHVTSAPGEALIRKCKENLDKGCRPVIITIGEKLVVAQELARQGGIWDRLDVFGAEQFLAGNLYELGGFTFTGGIETVRRLIGEYNKIIDECETDPGLKIKIKS